MMTMPTSNLTFVQSQAVSSYLGMAFLNYLEITQPGTLATSPTFVTVFTCYALFMGMATCLGLLREERSQGGRHGR